MKKGRKGRERGKEEASCLIGVRAVTDILRYRPERAAELLLSGHEKERKMISLAEAEGVPCRMVEEGELERLSGHANHQGVALLLRPREQLSVSQLVKRSVGQSHSVIVAVDELYDPQNFGSILRAAECFGADGVVWSKNRGVSITPAVAKVSVGASEFVNLCSVSNLRTALQEFKKAEYWVCAAAVGEKSVSLFERPLPERCVLVLGSEGKGVQPLIQKEADILLKIPMYGHIDSLNVSQAAAVLLSAYRSGHGESEQI